MTLHFLAALCFLACNIFFVLAEFSLVKANRPRLEVMRSEGRTRASIVLSMMDNLDNYLSAIQIGVTISTLALGWAGEPAVAEFVNRNWAWPALLRPYSYPLTTFISFSLVIYIQIVFAELVPRYVAIQQAERLALWVALPLSAFYKALRFPIMFMAKSSKFVARLIGFRPVGEHKEVFTEEEVRVLLGMSQEKGLLPLDRLLLIENLFDFEDLKARDAMVPKDKIVFLSTAKTWDENEQTLVKYHFSRYPLGNPDLDQLAGFVHVKDLALQGAGVPELREVARPLANVDESMSLQPLLKTMMSQGKHIVTVTKNNKLVGLITLEDVVEEILGEILDEFDAPNAWSFQNLLTADVIDLDFKATSTLEVVRSLLLRLKTVNPGLDMRAVEAAVMLRESQLSTAIGRGVAVPHARVIGLEHAMVAIGRSKHPLPFNSPDKVPVRLTFLILTPAAAPLEQMRILARVATLAKNETLLKQLMRAKTALQFLDVIRTSESIVVG